MLAAVGTLAIVAIGIGFVSFDSGAREFVANSRTKCGGGGVGRQDIGDI
jgi:hypothetical protein